MGVHRHGRLAKSRVQHHVRRLSAHAGQGFQRVAAAGDDAVVLLHQHFTRLQQVFGFAVVQADGFDVTFQPVQTQRQNLTRRVRSGEEPPRRLVHAHIGGLGA